jgi:diguanylate cyclase (GGDEF)-like protein
MTRAPAQRPLKDGTSVGSERLRADQDRFLGRFMALCACATVVLFVGGFATAPASEQQGLLPVAGLVGVVVALAVWFLKRGFSRRLFVVAGVVLMALGVVVGAALPDGLDAAVILPLTGALLVLPVLRGRLLLAMFVLAFAASIAGEIVAYIVGGMSEASGSVNLPISLAASAVMLVFAYGLVWWVSNEWLVSSGRTAHALTGQRHLLALNERLVATLDPQQVLDLIADSLKSVVAYDNLTIYRVDRDAGLLRPVLARDRFASLIFENTFALDHGITGWVVTHAEAQCINDAQRDPRMSLIPGTPAEDESLIVVPLVGEGDVVGTLNVGRMGGTESHFDSADFEIAQLFASQASIALLNAEVHRAVATRAETDALTGLHNRGAFEEHFPALLADRRAQPLTLLMLDLDGFKAFNDGHGHPAGDALLREVARSISAAVRAGDRVYRHGGDEFAVLLPATAPAVGARVAERIRAAIAMLDAGAGTRVTASIGAASNPDDATTRDGLVAAADAALYRAKESGGDCVAEAAGSRALATSASASPRTATLGPAPAEILGRVRSQPHRP